LSIGQRPAAWPPRRDSTPATLYKTGALRHSLRLSVGPQSALVTTDRPYAAIHQFGRITRPHVMRPRARQRPAVVFRRPAPLRHRFPRAAGPAAGPGGLLSLRTAGTPSLPWDLVGGAQSPVPGILADREDAVPPSLSELARATSDWGTLQLQHGPRGLISLRTAGTPSLPWDLVGGAQSPVPGILADREDAVPPNLSELERVFSNWLALQVRHRPRGQPFPADGGDAVPPVGPCGRGTVPCARHSCGPRGRGHSQPVGARKGTL
jgi:hypothetical protein